MAIATAQINKAIADEILSGALVISAILCSSGNSPILEKSVKLLLELKGRSSQEN